MSVDPRRSGVLCSDDPRCYRECRCSRWPDYKNRFGNYVVPHPTPTPVPEGPLNPGDMDFWITDRIPLNMANPESGNTGGMEFWITDRIPLNIWTGVP